MSGHGDAGGRGGPSRAGGAGERVGAEREHGGRRRARSVLRSLQDLWGDALPDGPDPELTALVDAVALDDELGRAAGLVVQADGLTLDVLAGLLRAQGGPGPAPALPPRLLARLERHAAGSGPAAPPEQDPAT